MVKNLKNFDFEPEVTTSDLAGAVLLMRELADTKLWKKKPFDPAHAIVDLHVLANNSAGTFKTTGGKEIEYKPGWCIWSKRGLAERWGWRQESVEKFMVELEQIGVIARHETGAPWKAVEIVSWGSAGEAVPEQCRSSAGDGGSLEKGVKESGDGGAPRRVISLESALKYFEVTESGYTTDQVTEQWCYYDAMRDPKTGLWQKPHGPAGAMIPVSDWRTELTYALGRFADKKNAAPLTEGVGESSNLLQRMREAVE